MVNRPCSVYFIDRDSIEGKTNSQEIVASIMRLINKEISEDAKKDSKTKYSYVQHKVKDEWLEHGLDISLYYRSHKYIPEWRSFITGIADENSSIKDAENKMSSIICFIYSEDYIFAICTGHGTFPILKYVDSMFGLEILTKLIDERSSVIKSRRSRGITGNTLAASQIFKKDQLILAEEAYGQLFKEISADLDFNVIEEKLGIDIGDRDMASCVAKSSFKLNKSINFMNLLIFIKHLILLKDNIEIGFNINRLKSINNRTKSEKELVVKLNLKLKKELHKYLRDGGQTFAFEICHKEYEEYFFADRYTIECTAKGGESENYDYRITYQDIKEFLRVKYPEALRRQKDFLKIVDKITVSSYDSNGIRKTKGRLVNHLNGEIEYLTETFFYIDSKWIQMIGNLVEELDKDVSGLLNDLNEKRRFNTLKLDTWNRTTHRIEDDYNASYIGRENTLVFHKVLYQNIEMADLVKWDDEHIYFVHVKKGFDSSMRDLASQVNNAARILTNEQKGNVLTFAEDMYDRLVYINENFDQYASYSQRISRQVDIISRDDFLSKFRTKKPIFCMAILDETDGNGLMNVHEYESNIAKLATLDLIRNMNSLNIDLYIDEI